MAGVYGLGFLRGPTRDAGMDAKPAIATELLLAGVDDIVVVNRSPKRAAPMVDDLKKLGPIRVSPWRVSCEVLPETDLVVNATSLGL